MPGLPSHPADAHRYGVAVGSGIGGLYTIEKTHSTLLNSGPRRVSPFFVPGSIINMISGNLSIMYGYTGPKHCRGDGLHHRQPQHRFGGAR